MFPVVSMTKSPETTFAVAVGFAATEPMNLLALVEVPFSSKNVEALKYFAIAPFSTSMDPSAGAAA